MRSEGIDAALGLALADKEFPPFVDTAENAGALRTLGIDLDTLAADAWAVASVSTADLSAA